MYPPITGVPVGASPFAYVAGERGSVCITGGTVSSVTLTRHGVTVNPGSLAGYVPVSQGDTVTVTYSVAPTIDFIPE